MTKTACEVLKDAETRAPRHSNWSRRGRFEIAGELVETNPRLIQAIFRDLVVLEAMYHSADDRFEYWAYGPPFEEMNPGYRTPFYRPEVTQITDPKNPDADTVYEIKFIRWR